MIIERGDIFFANLNPPRGKEISKIRPVLVISNNVNNLYSQTITILPISSYKLGKVFDFEVFIKTEDSNLPKDSLIKANQIRTIDKIRLTKKCGHLAKELMEQVKKAVCIHLDFDI